MPQDRIYSFLNDAIASTRSEAAAETADVLVALFGHVDTAEKSLLQVLKERTAYDRPFWEEVVRCLAEYRG